MVVSGRLDDPRRLAALDDARLLDVDHGETFDRLARLAARLLDVPITLITAVGADRKDLVGHSGVPEPLATTRRIPLSHSLCKHVVMDDAPLIVEDAREHPLVCDNPAVRDFAVIAYAGVPLRTAEGQVLGALCAIDNRPHAWTEAERQTLHDLAAAAMSEIDLRIAHHRALRREERLQLLETVAVQAHDAILITEAEPFDEPGPRILYVNEAFERMTGYTGAEIIGRTPRILHGAETDRAALDTIRTALQAWKPVRVELLNYRKDGSSFWVELSIVPVADATGWYTHWVSIQRETSERRRLEALRSRAEAAEALARLRNDFVACVSHELRTPLTAILGFAELLEGRWDRIPDDRRRRQVGHIAAAAVRQLQLVEDLLLASKLDATALAQDGRLDGEGQVPIGRLDGDPLISSRQHAELAPLLRRAATEVRSSYAPQQIVLSGPEDLAVLADPGRVVQIAVNLLDNAAKYSPTGSAVTAWWALEDEMAVLRVRDLGPGVPEDERSSLFSRFGRLPGSRMRSGRVGTGLGLYLGRQLAAAMGGSLDLEATGPGGSTFRLRLPRSVSHEAAS